MAFFNGVSDRPRVISGNMLHGGDNAVTTLQLINRIARRISSDM
jgi:hypothetical protein